jgi:Subtilisin-like serine proteases
MARNRMMMLGAVLVAASLTVACGTSPAQVGQLNAQNASGVKHFAAKKVDRQSEGTVGELVVRLPKGATLDFGSAEADRFTFGDNEYVLLEGGSKVNALIAQYSGTRGVLGAQRNFKRFALDNAIKAPGFAEPNDEFYSLQFGLAQQNIPQVWNVARGANTLVAVVDTGVDHSHPDLKGTVIDSPDMTFKKKWYQIGKKNPGSMDRDGHGTHVAGIIGAIANNNIGVAGVAPGAKILGVKVLGENATMYSVMKGIAYSVNQGAKVINLSLGGALTDSVERAFYEEDLARHNVLIVAAAGNDGIANMGFPASFKGVMAVGSVNQTQKLSNFSCYGYGMSVVAPGEGIMSTFPGGTYAMIDGTSMAAPFVSGAAALVWSKHPEWTAQQVRQRLEQTANDLGDPGFDPKYANGLINLSKALAD